MEPVTWTYGHGVFIWTLDARHPHTVWGSFRLVAVSVLAYGQLSIIIPTCRAWVHSQGKREEGVGRWLINRRVQIEWSSRLQGVLSVVLRLRAWGSGQAVLQPNVGKLLILWSIDHDNV